MMALRAWYCAWSKFEMTAHMWNEEKMQDEIMDKENINKGEKHKGGEEKEKRKQGFGSENIQELYYQTNRIREIYNGSILIEGDHKILKGNPKR